MNSELQNALQKRLEENYAVYMAQLTRRSFDDLVDTADEIAATKFICENLLSVCSDSDAALLLRFDNPLELMRDRWQEEIGVDRGEEIIHAVWTVRERVEDYLLNYDPAKPKPGSRKRKGRENER